EALQQKNQEEVENEMGDLLFSIVNLSRFRNVSAEDALRKTTNKFIARFQYIEKRLAKMNRSVYDSNLKEMDQLWEESKTKL
ncbi:MAG TPA: nucleoside triphosphate pyrophosphohydrolase, partial [Caldithrix sp.]|nr:nucleoside triphosphate pyrophosphohydrolase [Caldithrix sp.]